MAVLDGFADGQVEKVYLDGEFFLFLGLFEFGEGYWREYQRFFNFVNSCLPL